MDNKKRKGLVIALIISSLLFVLTLSGFLYLNVFGGSLSQLKVFEISNVDPALANKLTGSIIYSMEDEENSPYFSPSLEITFKYNRNLFRVSESSSYVYLTPKKFDEFLGANLKISQSSDIKGLLLETLYYDDFEVVEETEEEGINQIIFSYSQKSYIDESKTTTKFLSVIFKEMDDGRYAYIQIKDYDIREFEETKTGLVQILNTINTDISEVDQLLQAELSDGVLTVQFDRNLWTLTSQTQESMALYGNDDNSSSISFFMSNVYQRERVESQEAIREYVEDHFSSKSEYFLEKEYPFEKVGEFETYTIDGIEFEMGAYTFSYGYDPSTTETVYFGFLPGVEKLLQITTRTYSDEEDATNLVQTVLDSIAIKDEEIYSMSAVLGTSSVSINPATILGQSSTVRIFSAKCNDVTFSSQLQPFKVAGKTYTICSYGTGSGFVVDDIGHVVTNAHVADTNDLDNLMLSGTSKDFSFEKDFVMDIFEAVAYQYGPEYVSRLTKEDIENLWIEILYNIYKQDLIEIEPSTQSEIYVQGTEPFKFNQNLLTIENKSAHYVAELVDSNKITSSVEGYFGGETKAADVADLAIIKVSGDFKVPSISIMSDGVVTGQEIFVVGYPGLVDNKELIDTSVLFSSTVTQGAISAIKPNSNNTFKIIQIDASVESGNSGGPIISNEGNVVGVATYGISQSGSGNYNAGVLADNVEDMMSKLGISQVKNAERLVLEEALLDISNSYYSTAKPKLESLVQQQESLGVIINPFIELCQYKIDAGEDKKPMLDLSNIAIIIIPILSIILLVMIILLVVLVKSKKKTNSVPETAQQQNTVKQV